MIKDLIVLADRLDSKGLTIEADFLDSIISKMAGRDLGIETESKQYLSEHPDKVPSHSGFEWPWEVWNKLPEKVREDFYALLENLSWIPVLGVGALSAKFTLQCFQGDTSGAAKTFVLILINFFFATKFLKKVSLIKETVVQSMIRSAAIDMTVNGVNVLLEKALNNFRSNESFKEIANYISYEKNNIKNYVEQQIDQHLS
jgi:hypothetical protein